MIILGISILSINRISFIDRNLNTINEVNSEKQSVAIDYRGSANDRSISIRNVVLAANECNLESYIAEIRQREEAYTKAKEKMNAEFVSTYMLTTEEMAILDNINRKETATMPLI